MTGHRQIIAWALAVVFAASTGSPGLLLHNCRQFGTKSTQLCACCIGDTAPERGCCAKSEEVAPPHCSADSPQADASVASGCCFVSYEHPLSFHGQANSIFKIDHSPSNAGLLPAIAIVPAIVTATPSIDRDGVARHSSDPPLFLLTHSFRC